MLGSFNFPDAYFAFNCRLPAWQAQKARDTTSLYCDSTLVWEYEAHLVFRKGELATPMTEKSESASEGSRTMQVKHEAHRTPCALSDIISKLGLHLGRLHVKVATGDPASKHRSSSCGAQSVAKAGSAHRGRITIADTAQPTQREKALS